MGRFSIAISDIAERDLRDIYRYITAELKAPASNTMDAIEEAMHSLCGMPNRNALVRDEYLAAMGYRREIVKNYSVFYRVDEKQGMVNILRVLYNRRDWQHLL